MLRARFLKPFFYWSKGGLELPKLCLSRHDTKKMCPDLSISHCAHDYVSNALKHNLRIGHNIMDFWYSVCPRSLVHFYRVSILQNWTKLIGHIFLTFRKEIQ